MRSRWHWLDPFLYGLALGLILGITVTIKSNGYLLKEARAQLLAMGCGEPYEPTTIYMGKTPPSAPPPRSK